MSTVFTVNPIKLNLISIKNVITQTIVFIGVVPNDVRSELIKIESGKQSVGKNTILSRFYGNDWAHRLGIRTDMKTKRGGDEFSFDDDDLITGDDEQAIADDDLITGDDEQAIADDDLITGDDLNAIEPDNKHHITIDEKIQQITRTDGDKMRIRFIFSDPYLSIYPEDKVIEFKKKIYTVLNIPIYRQHIWYVYQGRTFPLSYSVFQNISLVYVNVQNMLNAYNSTNGTQQLIENIPVSTKYYQMKNELRVVTDDTFSILDDYFHKFGVSEYNMLDLDGFVKPSRESLTSIINERYQLELIYYSFIMIYWPMLSISAFSEYVKNEPNIPKIYPDLQPSIMELTQIYKLEKKIMDTKSDLITNPKKRDTLKKIREKISNSIVYAIMSVLKFQDSSDSVIFIRNLFDKFPLNDRVVSAKCYMSHNGSNITLNKTYKKYHEIKENLDLGSIMFKIRVGIDTIKTISVVFYANGNYVIKSTWRDEDQYDFDDVFIVVKKLVQPVVDTINSYGSYVLAHKKILPSMSKHNTKFTEIGMSMFYQRSLTSDQFTAIKNIMTDYRKAGIVRDKSNTSGLAEYYFTKGMYQFNASRIERVAPVRNYYEFLTDGQIKHKWYTIFEKTRITRIHHRFSDIKIEIVGIKEKEFFIFYNLIMTMLEIFNTQDKMIQSRTSENRKQLDKKTVHDRQLKKTLRNLKEQDPVLYNYKKLYKTENVYSKICQKPYQPLLLNKQGYDDLPVGSKKNAVKYWNFTTNKDAYYTCPNPKFPYIKFIIKRHPKDYCIPCCKKTQAILDAKDTKRIIYNMCMKDHKYVKEARTITMGSRYIMAYGKDVEPGRLSRLPDTSLEPLFYETYSVRDSGVDQECASTDGYYIYGVDQTINGVMGVGILNILIHTTETSLYDFIILIIQRMKMTPNKFRILLNGRINKHFADMETFISTLRELFLEPNSAGVYDDIPWNDIFINVAYMFLNINIVHFNHNKSDDVTLSLPSYITSMDQFRSPEFKNLIVIKKSKKYYPIYSLNTDVFFKVKMFTKKLFDVNDSITIIIGRLVESYFNGLIANQTSNTINLGVINRFVKMSDYKLSKMFINGTNMCYYVHLTSKDGRDIYIPIELSHHLESSESRVTYDMFSRSKHMMTMDTLILFNKDFNNWIARQSEAAGLIDTSASKSLPLERRVQPIYPYIAVKNWLVLCPVNQAVSNTSDVIGFISHNVNYYISPIKLARALSLHKVSLIQLFYDPDHVNQQIFTKASAIYDDRCTKIGKSIYNGNLYQLVLLEFMTIFNQQVNTQLRQAIKKTLLGNLNRDFDELMTIVSKLVPDCDDYHRIKAQIGDFINIHHSKNKLFSVMDDSTYKFDRTDFDRMRVLPKDKLIAELERLSHKFVTYGSIDSIKDFEFPNMFITCQSKLSSKPGSYCKNSKFVIEKQKLKSILDILASDILNPVKEKWIFSSVFADNVISFFKFVRRPDEFITVQIDD